MSMIEGVGDLALLLLVLVLALAIYFIKLAYDLKRAILMRSRSLDAKVGNLESRAVSIRREVVDLHKQIGQKLDKEEFEKRIDGLIELVGKRRETEKKKDAR